jgi:hypothetical protein
MGLRKGRVFTVVTNLCRWVLALVLVVSGFVKAVDPIGSMYKLQEYVAAFSLGSFSDEMLVLVGMMQAALEFLLGVGLFMGIYRCLVTRLAPLVMLAFTGLTALIYYSGRIVDCGCFGDALTLSNGETLVKNMVLSLLSLVVFLGRRRLAYNISSKSRWMVTIFATFYIALVGLVSLSHLPVVDFGPCAVGADMRVLTGGEPGEYGVVEVYERDGESLEWSGGERPDCSWNYVGERTVLVKEPKSPVMGDFAILDWEADVDVVPGLVADSGYVCIVVIEEISKASVSSVDKINELYDYCLENEVQFVAATASGDDDIVLWRKRTGAEYPILWIEEGISRRVMRANPGLLLLRDGVVVGKWNVADLPTVERYSVSSTGMPDGVGSLLGYMRGWRFWLLLLVLPLLFMAMVDVVACRKDIKARAGMHNDKDNNEK